MKKPKKIRKHKILNRHTVLGFLLLTAWAEVLKESGGLVDMAINENCPLWPVGILAAAAALLALWIHKRWFRPEFDGCLKTKNLRESMKLLTPAWIVIGVSAVLMILRFGFAGITLPNLALALMAGMGEETAFRAIPGSYMMRNWKSERGIVCTVLLTSLLFGGFHMINLLAGATLEMTAFQAVFGFSVGILACAVFLRTGSILGPVIMHTINDIVAFMDVSGTSEGIITQTGLTVFNIPDIIAVFAFTITGLYLIRKEKRPETLELWEKKWSGTLPGDPGNGKGS